MDKTDLAEWRKLENQIIGLQGKIIELSKKQLKLSKKQAEIKRGIGT